MPEVRLKQLYLANSLEALNKKVNVDTKESPKMLLKSIKTILSKAEESDREKDEEKAYLYSMRCFSIIQAIQLHEDYKKNKKYYRTYLDGKLIKKIVHRAEELSTSLQRRYNLLANANTEEEKEKYKEKEAKEIKEVEKKDTKNAAENFPKAALSDGFIGCDKLYSLTKERVSSFLVLDVRPKEDFENSSIKISTLINIPQELLKPGLTANKAGRELDENSRLLWAKRHIYDYIIICDWNTEAESFPAPIQILVDAMKKWDPEKSYRALPLVLKGGFEIFSLTYPLLVTNPKWSLRRTSQNSIAVTPLNNDVTSLNFSFPNLDEAFIATPSPIRTMAYPEVEKSVPRINRNLKPKILSPQNTLKREDSEDSLQNLINDLEAFSNTTENNNKVSTIPPASSTPPLTKRYSFSSSSSSSDIEEEEEEVESIKNEINESKSGILKTEPTPRVPSRILKPPDLSESFNVRKNILEEENKILEESCKAEQAALDSLREMEETRRNKEAAADEDTQKKLTAKESRLKIELEEKKQRMKEMERKYTDMHHRNEEEWDSLSRLMSDQLIISSEVPATYKKHREEKDALRNREEKQKALLKEVEMMKIKRKEKESEMEELQKKKEKEERRRLKENEETMERWRVMNDRNSRNSSQMPGSGKKRPGDTYTTKLRTSPRSSPVRGGSNMKRSHSALNLSQLTDEDGMDSLTIMPNFDRSLKPLNAPRTRNVNAARHRNFEPKYGSVPPTKTGLKNLGNTCYMNSIIQCLSNTFLLASHFFDGAYSECLNPKSNQRGEVAEEFGAVVRALWCSQYRSISMWDLKSVVGRHHKPFQGCDQHDSHEFLIKFMDWLHDDLNLVTLKFPKMEEQNFDENIPDRVAAQSVIEAVQERDESVVRDSFYGLHRSVITCHTCSHRSLTFEPFSVLTVSFPNGRCTLKDMLHDFYKETRIEYKCSKCRRMRNCSRKLDVWKLPPVLIIHLNRFEHDVLMKKKQNFVDFPLENLNFSEYTSGPNCYSYYDLYGVSNHYGTIDGGHYTAFCKSPHKTWYKFDDHEVYELPRESVKTSAAYILFYETPRKSAF